MHGSYAFIGGPNIYTVHPPPSGRVTFAGIMALSFARAHGTRLHGGAMGGALCHLLGEPAHSQRQLTSVTSGQWCPIAPRQEWICYWLAQETRMSCPTTRQIRPPPRPNNNVAPPDCDAHASRPRGRDDVPVDGQQGGAIIGAMHSRPRPAPLPRRRLRRWPRAARVLQAPRGGAGRAGVRSERPGHS